MGQIIPAGAPYRASVPTKGKAFFSHPTRIAEAVDELWGGALRYEEEL